MAVSPQSFKAQQRVRVNRKIDVTTDAGQVTIPSNTRAIVIGMSEDGRVRCKIDDPKAPALKGTKVTLGGSRLNITHRGRPKGSGASSPDGQDA